MPLARLMPLLTWRVVAAGFGALLFSPAVLILEPARWRLALTEICVGVAFLHIVESAVGFVVLRIIPRSFPTMTTAGLGRKP